MSRRERGQRLALDLNTNLDEEPFSAQDQAHVEEQFSKLVEDIERIKAGPAPSLNHTVLDEVENAPGWVRVSKLRISNNNASAASTAPRHYYWHPATGQLSWTPPTVSQDAFKSLEMTRTIITDSVERLQNAASSILPQVPVAARRAIQASTLLDLLDALAKEQQNQQGNSSISDNSPLEQMGSHYTSAVWCSVHACIAAAVAELGAPVPLLEREAEAPPPAAVKVEEEAVKRSDDDMEIEEHADITRELDPPAPIAAPPAAAAGRKDLSKGLISMPKPLSGKTTIKKSKTKSSSKLVGKSGASAMMNKWASVQKELKEDLEDGSDQDNEEDLDGVERKRLRQAEKWRTQQIRSGAVDGNSNFAPVMGNWRDRVKKTEEKEEKNDEQEKMIGDKSGGGRDAEKTPKEEEKKQDMAISTLPASTPAVPDLDALSVGLPRGWKALFDPGSGGIYYGNIETQATQWERPN